jgi:hypothetical protein
LNAQHVAAFLEEHDDPRIRLYAVDITESATLAAIRKCWKGRDARFQIRVANITKMKTEGIPCRVIANAANEWYGRGAPSRQLSYFFFIIYLTRPRFASGSRPWAAVSTWRSTRRPAPRSTRRPKLATRVRFAMQLMLMLMLMLS